MMRKQRDKPQFVSKRGGMEKSEEKRLFSDHNRMIHWTIEGSSFQVIILSFCFSNTAPLIRQMNLKFENDKSAITHNHIKFFWFTIFFKIERYIVCFYKEIKIKILVNKVELIDSSLDSWGENKKIPAFFFFFPNSNYIIFGRGLK